MGVLSSHQDDEGRLVDNDPRRFSFHICLTAWHRFLSIRTDPKTGHGRGNADCDFQPRRRQKRTESRLSERQFELKSFAIIVVRNPNRISRVQLIRLVPGNLYLIVAWPLGATSVVLRTSLDFLSTNQGAIRAKTDLALSSIARNRS